MPFFSSKPNSIPAPHRPTNRWMTDLAPWIGERCYSELAVVGTHDAATYNCTKDSDYSPDAPEAIAGLPFMLQPAAKRIVASWAKTQEHTVKAQLEMGVRYVDVRLCSKDGALWVNHSLFSVPFADVVNDIVGFYAGADDNKEMLLLDVQSLHTDGGDHPVGEAHELFRAAVEPLQQLFVKKPFGTRASLSDIWAAPGKQRVFLSWCDSHIAGQNLPDLDFATVRNDMLSSKWFNTSTPGPLVEAADAELKERLSAIQQEGGVVRGKTSHVLQTVLTADTNAIVAGIVNPLPGTSRSVADYADEVNSGALKLWCTHEGDGRNILLLDYFTVGTDEDGLDAVQHCIAINTRRYANDVRRRAEIVSGHYHSDDVGDKLRALAAGGTLEIGGGEWLNEQFGDPAPGTAKILHFQLSDGRVFVFNEGRRGIVDGIGANVAPRPGLNYSIQSRIAEHIRIGAPDGNPGTRIGVYAAVGGQKGQKWRVEARPDGKVGLLYGPDQGAALDCPADYCHMIPNDHGNANQSLELVDQGDGWYMLGTSNDQAIEVLLNLTADGSAIGRGCRDANPAKHWRFIALLDL
jgi:glycosylphosphatidylinositol diacylglycerol-lyase